MNKSIPYSYATSTRILVLLFALGSCLSLSAQNPVRTFRSNLSKPKVHRYSNSIALISGTVSSNKQGIRQQSFPGNPKAIDRVLRQMAAGPGKESSAPMKTFTVTGAITLNIASTGTTCGYSNGTINVSATGGTPPYQFSENGFPSQPSGAFSGLAAGTYNILVTDAVGGTATASVTLTNTLAAPAVNVLSSTIPSDCEASDANVMLSASGGTGPYTFSVDGTNFQPSNTFSNLSAGNFSFYVQDANGCQSSIFFPISGNCPPGYGFNYVYSSLVCLTEGSIHISNPYGGTPPYTYSMDNLFFQPSGLFDNLSPGIYTVYIKDAVGFVMSYSFPIYQYCFIALNVVSTDANCGNNDGSIVVSATNGTAPYLYSIDGINYQTSNSFTGLAPGVYTVYVQDFSGAKSNYLGVLINGGCLSVTASAVNVVCGNHNGSITATGTGGLQPYTYSIDGINFQSNNQFTGLQAGPYTVTIKDAAGITNTTTATITDAPGPTMTVVLTQASCLNNDGTLTINPIGGTAPYQYSLDGLNYQPGNVFNNLFPGPYTAWLKDANGCLIFQGVWWITSSCLTVSLVGQDPSCGISNGIITATATNGIAPYSYSIDGIIFQSGNVFNNLAAGPYTVTVKDGNGNSISKMITLNTGCLGLSLVTATVDPSCGLNNGIIVCHATNGLTPYQYSIDNGINYQSNDSFQNLGPGTYNLLTKDANASTSSAQVVFGNSVGPQLSATAAPAGCTNNDGNIIATAVGGTAPLLFSIDNNSPQASGNFTKLDSGTHLVSVQTADGCIASKSVLVPFTNSLFLDAGIDQTICEGTGASIIPLTNATGFSWTPASGLSNVSIQNPTASPLSNTKYYVNASLGICSKTDSITIFVNPAPIAFASGDTTICFGQSAQLNGFGGLTYSWTPSTSLSNPAISNPIATKPANTISYHLQVGDANGCLSLQNAQVTVTVIPAAKVFAGNDTTVSANQPLALHAIDVNNSGFIQYSWSPSTGLNDPNSQNPIATLSADITYTVDAIAPGGCEGTAAITVKRFVGGPDIYVPNAFTPNGDGRNDLLKPILVGIREFHYFMLYNRYGQLVFSTSTPGKGWDGIFNGTPQVAGGFVWMAEGKDFTGKTIQRKGTVLLIR